MWLEPICSEEIKLPGRGRPRLAAAALALLSALLVVGAAAAQAPPATPPPPQAAPASQAAAPANPAPAPPPAVHLTLDRAIELALQHNHTLLAERTTIDQNRAQEITANLRPNPQILADAQFLPIFQPSNFSGPYLDNSAQFDLGISYLIERGGKRHDRLKAAQDITAVTTATVTDNERALIFNVALQFINVLQAKANLALAQMDLTSYQDTVQISESRYQDGDMSGGDLLKIKLQLLQFEQDYHAAELALVQSLASLREFVGFDSIPESYDVDGELAYQPVNANLDDLRALALRTRPDLQAAQLGVTAAQSQYTLAKANGKVDPTLTFNYTHIANLNTGSLFGNIALPIFNRNQGEIARTGIVINQAQETQSAFSEAVLSDVLNAYEGLRTDDRVVNLFTSGYLQEATESRDISQYAYLRGAASLLDFLDAERSYRSTMLAYNQALAVYMLSVETLRQAVGTRSLP